MLTFPDFNPVALSLGEHVKIRWYGLMYVLGFLLAWWLARTRARKPESNWTPLEVDDLVFYAVFGVILGGRIGWLLFYGQQALAEDHSYWYKIWLGGMSFHGGMCGVTVALAILAWQRQRKLADVLDFTVPLPLLGIAAGRVGNFINSELWGRPTDLPWGFAVRGADGIVRVLHPSQLYEGALEGLALFALLWWFTSRPRPRWTPTGLFLVGYGAIRIALEFVRTPDVGIGYLWGGWLTMGMVLSVPMVLGGIGLLAYGYRSRTPSGNFKAAASAP